MNIPTLNIIAEFITPQEEQDMLAQIKKFERKRTKDRNSVQRFGSKLPYASNMVSESIPEYLNFICEKLFMLNLVSKKPDSVTINEYLAGQGIPHHIDSSSSGEKITILSLLSSAVMNFKKAQENFDVELPARSLIQMSNELRNEWQHAIKPVFDTRYSIVFRCGTN